MEHDVHALLAAWESFYVIIGTSAAALTGLQFVAITLGAGTNVAEAGSAVNAFSTPTVVHFGAALLISGILSAPWPTLAGAGLTLGACALAGLVYGLIVLVRARRQTVYAPVLEDWIWHSVLPLIAYAALLVAAFLLPPYPVPALFVSGGTALLLLFIGIHNVWDGVVYIAFERRQSGQAEAPPAAAVPADADDKEA